MSATLPRRAVLAAAAAATLAGCTQDKPIVLDRQAMVGIKRIGLPSAGVLNSPDVRVMNAISDRMAGFGLIGAIGALSGSIVRGNRSDALVRMMAANGFEPGPAFTAMLAADLAAKSLTSVPLNAEPKRRFLPSVANSPDYDAVLDCYVAVYGFFALNDSDDAPFRPTVDVHARLVGVGGVVLMQDIVVISAGEETPLFPAPVATAGLPGTFRTFSDIEKDPAASVATLRAAFEAAAAGVVRRIT